MKKGINLGVFFSLIMCHVGLFAQVKSFNEVKKQALDSLTSPDLLNSAEANYMAALQKKDTSIYNFVRDLNLKFKTFQSNSLPPGLGFSYQYDNSWTKNSIRTAHDFSQSFDLDLDGNVAFKKVDNPMNFLESKFVYNSTFFWGGLAKKNTKTQADQLRQLKLDRSDAISTGNLDKARVLEEKARKLTHITDQYYVGINGSASYESNQDFSKTQFVPSMLINAGASSFDNGSTLSWFNLPDYPFALLRYLTNTDEQFLISGVAIPSLLFGLDYVIPTADTLRQSVSGALNPYTRIRFETSFKTEAARAGGQVFWFSADYRWYHELNASQALINAHINHFNFFTCALSATNGFFVSYSAGQLPFDQKNSSVYSFGFNYNLGNWK